MDGHDEVDVDDDCHDDDDLVAIGLAYRHLPWRPRFPPPLHHHHDRTPFCCARCCAIIDRELGASQWFQVGKQTKFCGSI